MMDIFNMLGGMGQTQQQVSQQLGTDPNQTAAALEAAVPLLLGALTRNAQTPQGAASLDSALDQHTGDSLGMFQQGQMPDMQDGMKILGHVFGNQQNAAVNAVSQRAGINPQMAMQILMMLAPLVLNYLARQRGNARSGGMGGNVGASTGGIDMGSILGGILGGGGLGASSGMSLADSPIRAAAPPTSNPRAASSAVEASSPATPAATPATSSTSPPGRPETSAGCSAR